MRRATRQRIVLLVVLVVLLGVGQRAQAFWVGSYLLQLVQLGEPSPFGAVARWTFSTGWGVFWGALLASALLVRWPAIGGRLRGWMLLCAATVSTTLLVSDVASALYTLGGPWFSPPEWWLWANDSAVGWMVGAYAVILLAPDPTSAAVVPHRTRALGAALVLAVPPLLALCFVNFAWRALVVASSGFQPGLHLATTCLLWALSLAALPTAVLMTALGPARRARVLALLVMATGLAVLASGFGWIWPVPSFVAAGHTPDDWWRWVATALGDSAVAAGLLVATVVEAMTCLRTGRKAA